MQRIVINRCYGGFGLSDEAMELIYGIDFRNYSEYDVARDDPRLVQAVGFLGPRANGDFAELRVVEIPDDVKWVIKEYDGMEHIAEVHRTWS